MKVTIGYQLSYPEETCISGNIMEMEPLEKEGLYTAIFENDEIEKRRLTHGFADENFARANVPMTKEEIREIIISKLHLMNGDVIYDIGSGTGSIAIEMALLSDTLQVYAIEQNVDAVKLIHTNKEKFKVQNLEIIHAMAPEGLKELPIADCAFIGGSKGNLFEILEYLYAMNSSMRVVISAISLETIQQILGIEGRFPVDDYEVSYVQVSKSKALGNYHLL